MTTIAIFESSAPEKHPPDTVAYFGQREFESRLQWLESKGVKVQRYSLTRDADWSSVNPIVKTVVEAQGPDCLPIVTVDENIISVGGYPSPIELIKATDQPPGNDTGFLRLIAVEAAGLGAAVAANDFESFQAKWERLRSLGICDSDAVHAVQSATATAGSSLRDDMRTQMEQLMAFGTGGRPAKVRCSCGQ